MGKADAFAYLQSNRLFLGPGLEWSRTYHRSDFMSRLILPVWVLHEAPSGPELRLGTSVRLERLIHFAGVGILRENAVEYSAIRILPSASLVGERTRDGRLDNNNSSVSAGRHADDELGTLMIVVRFSSAQSPLQATTSNLAASQWQNRCIDMLFATRVADQQHAAPIAKLAMQSCVGR